ncbi:hypothetical protein EN35_04270 [Rhodococcus qingshengii]|nr:hypothetical protein EN35_04270 [Rhodococcus qingshengii]
MVGNRVLVEYMDDSRIETVVSNLRASPPTLTQGVAQQRDHERKHRQGNDHPRGKHPDLPGRVLRSDKINELAQA